MPNASSDDMTDRPALSPSALNRFPACEHRTYLDIRESPRGDQSRFAMFALTCCFWTALGRL